MRTLELEAFYVSAKAVVKDAGFEDEVHWANRLGSTSYSESDLLRESAWVVLCSGFRESVVRKWFDYISLCFCDWETAEAIVSKSEICKQAASVVFENDNKLSAIVSIASKIVSTGFVAFKGGVDRDPLNGLQVLPYVGAITAQHLAKNLGYPMAKNDRHLARLARQLDFDDAHELCAQVSAVTGDSVAVVDTILWRFCAIERSVRRSQS